MPVRLEALRAKNAEEVGGTERTTRGVKPIQIFGADLMSPLSQEPTTVRNFSMTRSGGAWGENE